ncbi:hypothetical protein SLS61_001885 [Didymella pomorum]
MLYLQLPTEVDRSVKVPFANGVEAQLLRVKGNKIFFRQGTIAHPNDDKLGRITSGPAGVKLQAFQTLHIRPGNANAGSDPDPGVNANAQTECYQLEPMADGRCEIIVLRHGDVITSPGTTSCVHCMWEAPEVQVNSSAVDPKTNAPPENKIGAEETPEYETEDKDEDEATLDDTVTEVPVTQPVTQPTKSQLSTAPHLPKDRSMVVHETPTANRILYHDDFNVATSNEARHIEVTPPPQGVMPITETFSNARTGQSPSIDMDTDQRRPYRSPEVRVGNRRRKRQEPEFSPSPEVASAAEEPLPKRTKATAIVQEEEGETIQASPLDNINADPSRMTYSAKPKRRTALNSETTPTKSSRSSQRSATATTVAAYEGPPPRVAISNSAIKEDSSTVKFLRKQGGVLVKNVEDNCNVLWLVNLRSRRINLIVFSIRDGGLQRTMKVIQAVALGVPIVTDKWLGESARADGLLDLASFKPSITKQEKDWNFSLEKVWGVPQNPFTGYALYFTSALKKTYVNFREMEKACQTLSAKLVSKRTSKNDKVIVLSAEDGDSEADKMIEDGEPCYHKDLLTTSILRGSLDLDSDEFKIKAKQAGPRRKGQQRKSI